MESSVGRQKGTRYVLVCLLSAFFLVSFGTKYADWKLYRVEVTKAVNNDGNYYKNIADKLVKGEKPVEYLNSYGLRPLFIVYLAGIMKIFGYDSDFIISVVNMILISLFLTLLAYMVMKRYGPTWYWGSFIAGVVFIAGNPLLLFWSPFILTDALAMAVLIGGMFIYLTMTHRLKYLLLGIIYALAFQIREVTFLNFIALLTTMFIVKEPKKNILTFLLTYLIIIVPWLLYIFMNSVSSQVVNYLGSAVGARKEMAHAEGLSFGSRFLINLSRHYFLYITDGGPIDTHGYYSVAYTLAMYVIGFVGATVLFIRHYNKEFIFITVSLFLTAMFYGFLGEGSYMRGRVLVEYVLMYAASIGLISIVNRLTVIRKGVS